MKVFYYLAIATASSILSGCSDLMDFNDGYQNNSKPYNYYGHHNNYGNYNYEYLVKSYTKFNPITGRYEKCKEYRNNNNNKIRVHCESIDNNHHVILRPQPR